MHMSDSIHNGLHPIDAIDTKRLEAVLRHKLPMLRVLWKESTESTNRDLMDIVSDVQDNDWTVLVANYQTSGRGRHERRWISPLGGLYVSVLVQLNDSRSPVTLLPLVAGLALKEAIEAEARRRGGEVQLRLKWPNDVFSERGKLAGVLCESQETKAGWVVVIGVGVNIYPLGADQERLLLYPGTSLSEEAELDWTRAGLLTAFLPHLAKRIDQWKYYPDEVRESWLQASGAVGRYVRVKHSKDAIPIEGRIRGIAETGALLVEDNGVPRVINSAESIEEINE